MGLYSFVCVCVCVRVCVCVFVSADEIPHTTVCIKYEFLRDFTELFLYSILVKITKNIKKVA